MPWITSALTVAFALQTLFVIGLLRSHADILRRLEVGGDDRPLAPASSTNVAAEAFAMPPGVVALQENVEQRTLPSVGGTDLDFAPVEIDVTALDDSYLLLAFLSTSCLTCLDIWRDILDEGAEAATTSSGESARLMLLLKGREAENLGKARALSRNSVVPVLFAPDVWKALDVPGSPYFALVETRTQKVLGAGSAQTWPQLRSLATDAMLELSVLRDLEAGKAPPKGYRSIIEQEDRELQRAGIYPGHASLYAPALEEEYDDFSPENRHDATPEGAA